MFTSQTAGKSVDSLSPLSPGTRPELPLHRLVTIETFPVSETQNGLTSVGSIRPGQGDIPPVSLTNIPIIDAAEFSPYLAQVGTLYEQLRRVKDSEDEAVGIRRGSKAHASLDAGSDTLLRPTGKSHRRASTASIASLASIEAPSPSRRLSSGFARRALQGPAPLSTIPTVYFDDDFHLENPRTFDVVSERSEVIRPPSSGTDSTTAPAPRKALATNAILQEKLSWYMDTIEVHLINSISAASTTFFTALGSLKELHSEAAESVDKITTLRQELRALDEEVATNGLLIAQKRRRRENLRQLHDAVAQLRLVVDGVAKCESMVDAGDVDQALSSIDTLEKLIAGEREEADKIPALGAMALRDLRGASALQGINQDLSTLRFRAGKAYESQFISLLLADLRRHASSVSASDVLLRWSNAVSRQRGGNHSRSPSMFPTYLASTEELKSQILPNMRGLHRARCVVTAALAYRDTVLREVRNLVRRPLPSSNDEDNESMLSVSTTSGSRHLSSQEKSANLARNLRALDPEDAEELLVKVYVGVAETLRRLTTQVKVLLDVASSLSNPAQQPDGARSPPARSPVASPLPDRHAANPMNDVDMELQQELHKSLEMNNLLTQAVDVANEKIVKILRIRTEQATNLPLVFFLRYFTLNLYFANECEAISGRSGTSLKTVVNGHIKDFVQRYRDAEMQKLAQGMEADQWNAKDFTDSDSRLLGLILGSSTNDDDSVWTGNSKIWIPRHEAEKLTVTTTAETAEANGTNGTSKDKIRSAVIESEKFILPNSARLCLDGIGNFMHLMAGIPSMTTDVASSLLAYLQVFNSRCTQLILGAGATRSAGLKNITTKHLALASQALSFVATLVPHVREFARSRAGSGAAVSGLMGEFDKVRRLLQEHQSSIHQKLVDIMSGRAAVHAKSLRAIDWDSADGGAAHPCMEILVKETCTLHRVLTKHLPETSIHAIMTPVFASYKEQLGVPLREAAPKTEAGQQCMLRDVEFLASRLCKIKGFGDAGDYLTAIVKSKAVKASPSAEDVAAVRDDEAAGASVKEGKEEAAAAAAAAAQEMGAGGAPAASAAAVETQGSKASKEGQ
ncbi:hypothetical protein UVI_02011480 [Ustilaginoidea virens]|uniref:Vacuolar protein sorting-associated protein 54 n=1 Tax=Ustilaginoidea virens TaxID=1159556 RepID=A0A1B5L5S7_USTVR|nr:hypothetical protein UVI_02011480 [Ustilaginoidea virens]